MIDIIGSLYDEEGAQLPGFHVNIVAPCPPELEAYRVDPSPLRRVWAGDDPENPQWTVPLRFADETEALTLLNIELEI